MTTATPPVTRAGLAIDYKPGSTLDDWQVARLLGLSGKKAVRRAELRALILRPALVATREGVDRWRIAEQLPELPPQEVEG